MLRASGFAGGPGNGSGSGRPRSGRSGAHMAFQQQIICFCRGWLFVASGRVNEGQGRRENMSDRSFKGKGLRQTESGEFLDILERGRSLFHRRRSHLYSPQAYVAGERCNRGGQQKRESKMKSRIAFFDTKPYDKLFFDEAKKNTGTI